MIICVLLICYCSAPRYKFKTDYGIYIGVCKLKFRHHNFPTIYFLSYFPIPYIYV